MLEHKTEHEVLNVIRKLKLQKRDGQRLFLAREAVKRFQNNELIFIEFCEALVANGFLDEAIGGLRQALRLKSATSLSHGALITTLFSAGQFREFEREMDRFVFKLEKVGASHQHIGNILVSLSNLCLLNLYRDDISTEKCAQIHNKVGNFISRSCTEKFLPREQRLNKIRIGFVSNQLYESHPVGRFSISFLESIDFEKFDVFVYHNTVEVVNTYTKVKAAFANTPIQFRQLSSLKPKSSCDIVRGDKIDVLIDLAGYTEGSMLPMFAYRAAPIQASWIGYPQHPGLKQIDYFLSDDICSPMEGGKRSRNLSELYRFKRFFTCYNGVDVSLNCAPPCKANGYITFGSFNNINKINRKTIAIWAKLLRSCGDSRLVLKFARGNIARENDIVGSLVEAGVRQENISLLESSSTVSETLSDYNKIDIALDTFPFNGMTTTCDAIWMGVPVLTIYGNNHVSCASSSILKRVGLNEYVSSDASDFVQRGMRLANDLDGLNLLKKSLRSTIKTSEICNADDMNTHFAEFVSYALKGRSLL